MIPRIAEAPSLEQAYVDFLKALKHSGFEGQIHTDYADRVVLSTDNSIYQRQPQAVVYPRHRDDVVRLCTLLGDPRFRRVVVAPRGGGTGTNGQSLSDGIIVDLSRHMNQILEFNPDERWVRVQSGVVKDQLNAFVKSHGLFFAPELSTSNRATIGGMVNTDASGQGSCRYGKTRDHVLETESVMIGGQVWTASPLSLADFFDQAGGDGPWQKAQRTIHKIYQDNRAEIEARFPKLNRCLTGYDLAHIVDKDNTFNLNSILCGSEGTLAFLTEVKLNLVPIPKYSALVNVCYADFQHALEDARTLMSADPASIETVDGIVLGLARDNINWSKVQDLLPKEAEIAQGVNFVEFTDDCEDGLKAQIARFEAVMESNPFTSRLAYQVVEGDANVKAIWGMRKLSVGLLGNVSTAARPIPFVEDTAVPPENLPDFIREFRAMLDRYGLPYGMFGHVDAGVLHVRPALDMKVDGDKALLRPITDEVQRLVTKYNGLLWGEHGKGVRSEYVPEVFGPQLYACLQDIKSLFDPYNQLNPGKICVPKQVDAHLLKLDEVPLRGDYDRKVPEHLRTSFDSAMNCNGNGACFNYDLDDAMCPSWKATRERRHSPKGRSSLIREWVYRLGQQDVKGVEGLAGKNASLLRRLKNSWGKKRGDYDFSHEVMEAMDGCLACKSCVSQCPIKVNVPAFRSLFLSLYYTRYVRPLRHYLIANLEGLLPYFARVPKLYNAVMGSGLVKAILAHQVGMVDSPLLSGRDLVKEMKVLGIEWATPDRLEALSAPERAKAVVVVQDAFTRYFETDMLVKSLALLKKLGFMVFVAAYQSNGKPLQVHGFLDRFRTVASQSAAALKVLEDCNVPLVGLEPSMTLVYRQEYAKVLPHTDVPNVQLVQEWLATKCDHLDSLDLNLPRSDYVLLPHCTEKTSEPAAFSQWQSVFASFGLGLSTQPSGCCGMAGTYGHEADNLETSKEIYALSWQKKVNADDGGQTVLATGYSCRCQVKRLDDISLSHPLDLLHALVCAEEMA
ncbi:FAD-binding and (Fe-S)-binding domain-containing protein [Terasakiella pusilla]|uniref:D-2-hydroxyglutarate dehydrogenase YdiJ n=1 Tax=Terasakiella pusilla TaxID=64973 RepID=UPI003AA8FC4D